MLLCCFNGVILQVIILCFAVFYGGSSSPWSSHKHTEYATSVGKSVVVPSSKQLLLHPTVRSRSLLSVNANLNFPTRACDWFKQIFMREQPEDPEFGGSRNQNQPITRSNIMSMNISCPLCIVR